MARIKAALVTSLALLSSSPGMAVASGANDDAALQDCVAKAARLGDAGHPTSSLRSCASLIARRAAAVAFRKTDDGRWASAGFENMLFTQTPRKKVNVVSGDQTRLARVRALALEPEHGEIFVLSGSEVLVFRTSFNGNIAPVRRWSSEELQGAAAVAVSPERDEVYLVHPEQAAVLVHGRQADVDGRRPVNSTALKRRLSGGKTLLNDPVDLAVDSKRGELFVLDRATARVLVFAADAQSDSAPIRVIEGDATLLSAPVSLEYLPASGRIRVRNGDGSSLEFKRDASGNSAPFSRY